MKNGELVAIGQNQVIRSLFSIKNKKYSQEEVDELITEKKTLGKKPNDSRIVHQIKDIDKKINNILFISEIISIVVKNKTHYKKILDGLYVNGKRYVRLLAGSGNIRRDTIIFCDESVKEDLMYILDAGRDTSVKLTPSKYSAYFALANSAGHSISYPRFCVIPDCEVERITKVDWVYDLDNGENDIEERDVPIKFNLFDGQGLISVQQSMKWAKELDVNYTPSCYTIRGAFTKGLLVTFDIHLFCQSTGRYYTTDVWGSQVDLRNIDVIFTASQAKLWMAYKDHDDFVEKCIDRDFGYSVTRVSPEKDRNFTKTNYQFLQVLNLTDEQIESLCKPTVDYLSGVSGMDRDKMLLYYLGDVDIPEDNPLQNISDPLIKALVLDENMVKDPYLRQHTAHTLNKKIHESYIGTLYVPGNYQVMISDPYAFMEHCVGLPVKGLLENHEHYSNYWNEKDVSKVIACRAPLTYISEANILNFKKVKNWYMWNTTGIIINVHGIDVLLHADADMDGDLLMTSSSPEMISGVQGGLPISYAKKIAPKIVFTERDLVESDINGLGSKIGFITNLSSTTYAMLEGLDKGSPEYKELFKRLKLFRYFQGENIDKAKNGGAKELPKQWTNWTKIKDNTPIECYDEIKFNNSILIDKRPYFFRHLYRDYNKKYLRHMEIYDKYCGERFGTKFCNVIPDTEEKKCVIKDYYRFSFFIHNDSTLNRLCQHMENSVKEYRKVIRNDDFDYMILVDKKYVPDSDNLKKMASLCKKFQVYKRKSYDKGDYDIIGSSVRYIRKQAIRTISSNVQELATLAVYCTYRDLNGCRDFVWKLFEDGVVNNIISNMKSFNLHIPIQDDEHGKIEYLWTKYSNKKFSLFGDIY